MKQIQELITEEVTELLLLLLLFFLLLLMSILLLLSSLLEEDKFSLCECACLEKKIFKGLHQIFYVQIVFGYYFANNVGGATIWTNFDNTYSKTICM